MQSANNVMVLYTGGTIGMQASANGLAPASGFEVRMREQFADADLPAWRFREMSPLIDSANMNPAYWQRLRTAVETLSPADREEEIARMLAGAQITDAARAAARALMHV